MVMYFGDIEGGLRTEMGYSRKLCDGRWMIVRAFGLEVDALMEREFGFAWGGDMDDKTLIFMNIEEAEQFIEDMDINDAHVFGLGDWWRVGSYPPQPVKYATSDRARVAMGFRPKVRK